MGIEQRSFNQLLLRSRNMKTHGAALVTEPTVQAQCSVMSRTFTFLLSPYPVSWSPPVQYSAPSPASARAATSYDNEPIQMLHALNSISQRKDLPVQERELPGARHGPCCCHKHFCSLALSVALPPLSRLPFPKTWAGLVRVGVRVRVWVRVCVRAWGRYVSPFTRGCIFIIFVFVGFAWYCAHPIDISA